MELTETLLRELLTASKDAVWAGKGKAHARRVRRICDAMGWDEDEFLESYVKKDKERWGLPKR